MNKKFVRVMNGTYSHAGGFEFKIGEINVAKNWNPNEIDSSKQGGFNFSNEENNLRWIIRGNTLYAVEIPTDASVVEYKNYATPKGIFRTNKIIVRNPRFLTDELALNLYKKSNMPERTYYKTLAALAIRNCYQTCLELIKDRANQNNIDEVLTDYLSFSKHINDNEDTNDLLYNEILEILYEIKSDLLISIVVDKEPYIKELTNDHIINLTGQSGSGKSTYAKKNFNNTNYLVVDTDDIFSEDRFIKASGINKELGDHFRKKFKVMPELGKDFDIIYEEILDYCKNKKETIVIDCAQFHCIKDINKLKGKIIVIRTSINTCYNRCIERYKKTVPNYNKEDLEKYANRKKGLFKWYKGSNDFIKKIDSNL